MSVIFYDMIVLENKVQKISCYNFRPFRKKNTTKK